LEKRKTEFMIAATKELAEKQGQPLERVRERERERERKKERKKERKRINKINTNQSIKTGKKSYDSCDRRIFPAKIFLSTSDHNGIA